jgi:hypothetical protein
MAKSYKKYSRRRRNSMKGGDGWNHAVSVYGNGSDQHAVGPLPNGGTSNVIAMNSQSGGNGVLTPALFNEPATTSGQENVVINSNSASDATRIMSGGAGWGSFFNANASAPTHHASAPTHHASAPTHHSTFPGFNLPNIQNIFRGGKKSRKGGNVLGEIAVPATLLIANEFAKNRSNLYTNSKKSSKGKKKLFSLSRSRKRSNRRR